MQSLVQFIRSQLRRQLWWIDFQDLNREGWLNAYRRHQIQKEILTTSPLITDASGDTEVRILTWRRDWLNSIWALKSFYHFSKVRYPLYIHDGGLLPSQAQSLKAHFPNAHFIDENFAHTEVESILRRKHWMRCLSYRNINVSTRKLFDFFLLSKARRIISIDSDIVFFKRAEKLLLECDHVKVNRYNEDMDYWYSMSLDELEAKFGIRPPAKVNSGLSVVDTQSIRFDLINTWLENPKLYNDRWVTEQTLHALCSTLYGIELLPKEYLVSKNLGLTPETVCKHYPGITRRYLYEEGMRHLIDSGFLKAIR